MKRLTFLFLLFAAPLFGQHPYSDSIQRSRTEKEREYKNNILNAEELGHFKGICHFDVDSSYRLKATFTRKKGKKFAMPMSRERLVYYRQYGVLTFSNHDTLCELIVYENLSLKGKPAFEDYLFLPLKDGTTAVSTYGAGRYVDVYKQMGNEWIIDFNGSYHPYCAYSERYSCPLVPKENTIAPHILAGECYFSQ